MVSVVTEAMEVSDTEVLDMVVLAMLVVSATEAMVAMDEVCTR